MTGGPYTTDFGELVDHLVAEHGLDRDWCVNCHPDIQKRRMILDTNHRNQHKEGVVHRSEQAFYREYLGDDPIKAMFQEQILRRDEQRAVDKD